MDRNARSWGIWWGNGGAVGGSGALVEIAENAIDKGNGGHQGNEHDDRQGPARWSDTCSAEVQGHEWNAATPQVILAEGTTSKMKLKGTLTLITLEDIQPIVPMGVLTLMGYEVEWKQGNCRVRRRNQNLEVEMVDSCPMVDARVALNLIDEMEIMEERQAMRLAAMKMPMDELNGQPELARTKAPEILAGSAGRG